MVLKYSTWIQDFLGVDPRVIVCCCFFYLSLTSLGIFCFLVILLAQVSVVGIVRRSTPYKTNVQYCVDDMTGLPLMAKQWVSEEASNHIGFYTQPQLVRRRHH